MSRFETVIVLALVFCVFTTGALGGRIVRDASPESDESPESSESKHPFDAVLKSLKKHADDVQKQLQVRCFHFYTVRKYLMTLLSGVSCRWPGKHQSPG